MRFQDKEIRRLNAYGKTVKAVYAGVNIVWQAVRSCFGPGYWTNNKPWLNNEQWKNK